MSRSKEAARPTIRPSNCSDNSIGFSNDHVAARELLTLAWKAGFPGCESTNTMSRLITLYGVRQSGSYADRCDDGEDACPAGAASVTRLPISPRLHVQLRGTKFAL